MNIDYDAYQTFANKVATAFQTMLKETAARRKSVIKPDKSLYRARKGYDRIVDGLFNPYPIDFMLSPPPNKTYEGRVNPKGIPCFYAADKFTAAVMELRPWIGELISVAVFRTSKELNIADITNDDETSIKFKRCLNKALPNTEAEIEKQIWSELNNAFSEPVSNNDQTAKYAPTQIISEWLKSWGYDGVVYKSYVHSEGKNYAFFNPSLFSVYNEAGLSRVVRVSRIEVSHDPANTILTVHENRDKAE